ncbi:DUF721 domain-containing protein [Streptomyces sp. ISL-98]|uniref:DciA family protein n=1 Tax=Streptomyces sp. ISL-98 TaxID=2819192 RepID=UPI001BE5A860|nr:DciA family protein [Streptomyces sp. ISL-98]MBT2509286.1 DUF721 domain-containing protein [Streptomyces sp. ISL-98]
MGPFRQSVPSGYTRGKKRGHGHLSRSIGRSGGPDRASAHRHFRRLSTSDARDGRDPLGLGDAIGALITERARELPAAGGALRDRRPAIAPAPAEHVAATEFDAEARELTLRPEPTAWAAKAGIEQTRIVRDVDKAAGGQAVRRVRVLAPGSVPAAAIAAANPAPFQVTSASEAPRTRETASASYRRALASQQAAKPAPRLNRVLRRQSSSAPVRSAGGDGPGRCAGPIEASRIQRRRAAAATEANDGGE